MVIDVVWVGHDGPSTFKWRMCYWLRLCCVWLVWWVLAKSQGWPIKLLIMSWGSLFAWLVRGCCNFTSWHDEVVWSV